MAAEDPWDPGPVTSTFRVKCPECGRQVQFVDGRRVQPDCGHEIAFLRLDEADP